MQSKKWNFPYRTIQILLYSREVTIVTSLLCNLSKHNHTIDVLFCQYMEIYLILYCQSLPSVLAYSSPKHLPLLCILDIDFLNCALSLFFYVLIWVFMYYTFNPLLCMFQHEQDKASQKCLAFVVCVSLSVRHSISSFFFLIPYSTFGKG